MDKTIHTPWRRVMLSAALTTLAAASGLALAQTTPSATPSTTMHAAADSADPASSPASAALLPPVKTSQGTKYTSGGIGKNESEAMKAEARHWPLALEFAVRAGQGTAQFAADVDVRIQDAQGKEVLHATSEGPFLLARLAPGHYTVRASLAGQAQTRHVHIEKDKPLRLLISWPAGQAQASPT